MRPIRRWRYRNVAQLNPIQVSGGEHLQQALQSGKRVLLAANHPSHADPFAVYAACERLGTPCHIMAAWHVFAKSSRMMQRWLQWHGCFSIDREAADLTAFREAVEILKSRREPLLIFPEGDIYHCNDRLTPFREGAFAIALAAAKRAAQDIVVVPTALRYTCASDPTEAIAEVLSQIETRLLWRPQTEHSMVDRIRNIGRAVLGLKEQEFYGYSLRGPLPERIVRLAEFILDRLETQHGLTRDETIPKRVKKIRQKILSDLQSSQVEKATARSLKLQLDEVFLALQLFSYPGDYLDREPVTIERIAETVDKFEEDVLQVKTATLRCRRNASVCFGLPVPVMPTRAKDAPSNLTREVESRVRTMLFDHSATSELPLPSPGTSSGLSA